MRILVAEDTGRSLQLLVHYLGAKGHEVWPAVNGREALALCAEKGAPDLVISDALMPSMDGFELCYAMRRDPLLCPVPFILYTATYTAESDERFALSVGVDRYVVKPVEPDELNRILLEVCEAVRQAPPRKPSLADPRPAFLEEYSKRVSLKLEDKLQELAAANDSLTKSERTARRLNEELNASLAKLQAEVVERRLVEEHLQMALRVGGLGTWEYTSGSRAPQLSLEFKRMLGLPEASSEAWQSFLSGLPGEAEARLVALMTGKDNDTQESKGFETRFLRPNDRSPRQLLFHHRQISPGSGSRILVLGTVRDVTEERHADEVRRSLEHQLYQSQKMEAIGNLAGGIAHDFNNILTAIFGHAEMIKLQAGSTPALVAIEEDASQILQAAGVARDTIRQILTFSRREPVERRAVVLDLVVEQALRLVRSTLPRNVRVESSLHCKHPVLLNETQIQQVLLNLCTNAAHAMKDRPGLLRVCSRADSDHAILTVEDDGCGIPPSVLERIFEPFFTTKKEGEGTGLGLAVVHGIVQSHEGKIDVSSTEFVGTCFTLRFPLQQKQTADKTADPRSGSAQAHALVVDDEPGNAHLCSKLLEMLGYRVTSLNDPVEARATFLRNPEAYDLAMIDFLMPRLNGLDLARCLRGLRKEMPIILISGFGGQIDLNRAQSDGVSQILVKPYTLSSISDCLARITPGGGRGGA